MGLLIDNLSGVSLEIGDLGITIPIGGQFDLLRIAARIVVESALTGDLDALLTANSIQVLDPIDNITALSLAEGRLALREHNDTHFRLGSGSRIGDLSNVTLTGLGVGNVLTWDGSNFTPSVAGGSAFTTFIPDSGGNVVADSTTDTLTLVGGTNIATVGTPGTDTITFNWAAVLNDITNVNAPAPTDEQVLSFDFATSKWIAGDLNTLLGTGNLSGVQIRRTTNFAVTNTFQDITFDITDVENDPTEIEHNAAVHVGFDNITVHVGGFYKISYNASFDIGPAADQFEFQVRKNDLTVIPGSLRQINDSNDMFDIGNDVIVELAANDFITLQSRSIAGNAASIVGNTLVFNIIRLRGSKGDAGIKGDPGSGSNIVVQKDDVTVGTVTDTLNFEGPDVVTVVDEGANKTTVTLGLFGSQFQKTESAALSSTNAILFQNKVTLNTTTLPAGTYRVAINYGWNHNATNSDFEAEFLEDTIRIGEIHKQEPKDAGGSFSTAGTSQRHYVNKVYYRTFGTAATHTYALNFRTDDAADTSSIWDAMIELWRVS